MEQFEINIYHFDVEDAVKYGVEKAVLLKNLKFWIAKNKANNKHFYDNHYWTYNTSEAFAKLFPFWTPSKIWRLLDQLEKDGVIKSGNHNKSKYDRTKWYTVL